MLKSFRSAALLAAVLACATPAAAANLKATVSQAFQSMLYLPLYVAIDEGLFEKAGIDVTKETAGAPSVALSAVISKSAQFSLHGPEWTAVAASKGAPVNIICNVVNGAAVWIAATPDFPFKEAKDLKGQTIVAGLMPTTSTSLFLKYLKENGMSKDDVNITQVQIGTEPGPFLAGQAKVAVMYEPGLDQVVAKGMKVLVGFPQHYGAYAFSAISARKDVDPAAAQAFVNGLQAALVLMKSDPAKAIAVAKKEFPTLDPAVVEAAVKRMMAEKVYPESADIAPDALKVGLDTQIALGNLAAQPDYATFVRHDFIDKAVAGTEAMQLHTLGLIEAVRGIQDGRLDAAAYRAALVERIRRIDPEVRAFTCLADPDATVRGGGPLAGVAVAVKDIIATKDLPTTNGSEIYADHVPDADAWVVERLRSLGAVVLGKTVTTEFAWRHPGPTRNPWNLAHTPGGSSSGSAAAVAAGLAPLALGSQTFGSVIRPAAFCGVVGLKPSYGAIPRTGIHPLAPSLDHVGVFTRSVADAAFALSLLAASSDADPHGQPLPGFSLDPSAGLAPLPTPRLAFVKTSLWNEADLSQRTMTEAAAARFATAGGIVEEFVLPDEFAGMWDAARIILACEASATFGPLVQRHPGLTSAFLKELVAEGARIAAPAYVDALRLQTTLRKRLSTVLAEFDAILTLPAAGPAPEGLANTGNPAFCVPWTFLGVPCLSLPAGEHDGLPIGIQLVGPYRDDLRLLRVAAWCEAILDHPAGTDQG